jgi:NAD(P)-dependent dehydrogenase (short-subunit alcohol dehydrogenase family)
MQLLANHIAAITGAGSGIGRAIALGFARAGARIVALDIDEAAAAATAQAIRDGGTEAASLQLDVSRREDCISVAQAVTEIIGPVSILVNNAGINRRNGFTADADAVAKDWQDIMAVNLDGPFNVTQAFLGALIETRGRIVNIGSMQSFVHVRTPSSPAYTTSKHGVLGFTRALAAELGRHGVRVNAIGPGLIETPLNAQVRANDPELMKIFLDHTPLGRTGRPEDIVGPAIFLASDLAAYVTGAMLMADGGYRTI